ncbi:MAG: pentapeptide repeat-containing protein [Polyangiales bacterium]
MKLLAKEGAKFDDKLGDKTTLFVFAVSGSANHERAHKLKDAGQDLSIVSESVFRQTCLVPTPAQATEMLASHKDTKRLAALLEQAREEYSRGTDAFSEVRVKEAKLGAVDVSGAELYGVRLEGADLRKATMKKTCASGWVGCDLRDVEAPDAEFYALKKCDFRKAALTSASLHEMSDCVFDSADLSKTHWYEEMRQCRFDKATLDRANITRVKVSSCSFGKASLKSAKLHNSTFSKCNFQSASFQEASFAGEVVVFEDCDFGKADFRGAWLLSVRFVRCKFDGARFDGAHFDEVEFDKSNTAKAKNLDWTPTPMGPALTALSSAAPTFKNVTIEVTLKSGRKKLKCLLYQFDHGTNSSKRQAFLAEEDLDALSLWGAMKRIATLHPDATLDEKTLKVKQTKGKTAPSHKPAAFKTLVQEAWQEALA